MLFLSASFKVNLTDLRLVGLTLTLSLRDVGAEVLHGLAGS